MKKLIFSLLAITLLGAGCGKKSGSSAAYNNGGYGGYGYNSAGATGAVGSDSYGRFTLGLQLGLTNGGGQIGAAGTLLATQPLGCMSGYGSVGIPAGTRVNLALAQPGQVTAGSQIYNLVVGSGAMNGLGIEVVVQNATIQALPGGVRTCIGGTTNELYGMVTVVFRVNGQVACTIPSYIDLQSAGGC